MPIGTLEREVPRLPRLGKIRLGIKVTSQKGNEYPKKVDYFVVKPDGVTSQSAAEAFHEVYGEHPREIDIMFPIEDESIFMPTWFKAYRSFGLFCKGPGPDEQGKPGIATRVYLGDKDPTLAGLGGMAEGLRAGSMIDVPLCDPETCPYYTGGECKQNATLQILLPQVRGLGVWQITTSSWNSIRNIRGGIRFIRGLTGGRIAWLPLKMRLVPQEVTHDAKKVLIYVLQLAHDVVRLTDILSASQKTIAQLLLPEVAPADEDEIDGDQYPAAAAAATAQATGARVAPAATGTEAEGSAGAPPPIDPSVHSAMGALGWPLGKSNAQWATWWAEGKSIDDMHSELRAIASALVDERGHDPETGRAPGEDPPSPAEPPARRPSPPPAAPPTQGGSTGRGRATRPPAAARAATPPAAAPAGGQPAASGTGTPPPQRAPASAQQSLLPNGAPLPPEPPAPEQRRRRPMF